LPSAVLSFVVLFKIRELEFFEYISIIETRATLEIQNSIFGRKLVKKAFRCATGQTGVQSHDWIK